MRAALIDRMAYWIEDVRDRPGLMHPEGRLLTTRFMVKLGSQRRWDIFGFGSTAGSDNRDEMQTNWEGMVTLLQERVYPRLVTGALGELEGGGSVTVSNVTLSPDGVKASGRFAQLLPWAQVGGIHVGRGTLQLSVPAGLAKDGSPERKLMLEVLLSGWNAVLFPRLAGYLIGNIPPELRNM